MIAGYFGFNNSGDELILACMLRDLKITFPDVSIVIVSGNPESIRKIHKVESIAWADIRGIINVMPSCDLVILGGGGLFHDYWGMDSSTILTSKHIGISFYTTIALLSSFNKIPLMLYAVGVGPLFSDEAKLHVRAIGEIASLITVRDNTSAELLHDLGISTNKIEVTADPVFTFVPVGQEDISSLTDNISGLTLGVALRNWDVGVDAITWELQVAKGMDDFLEVHPNFTLIFVPFQNSNEKLLDDFSIIKRVRRLMRNSKRTHCLKKSTTFTERAGALGRCDLVLGMRLHALIIAAINKVPLVGLSYDPKINRIMSQLKMDNYVIPLRDLSGEAISTLLESAYQGCKDICRNLSDRSIYLANEEKKNAVLALQLLQKNYKLSGQTPKIIDLVAKTTQLLSQTHDFQTEQVNELITKVNQLEAENVQYKKSEMEMLNEMDEWKKKLTLFDSIESTNKIQTHQINGLNKKLNQLEAENSWYRKSEKDLISELDLWRKKLNLNELTESNRKIQTSDSKFIETKLNQIFDSEVTAENKTNAFKELRENIKAEIIKSTTFNFELLKIKNSRGWKLLWSFWQIRQVLFPHNSWREKVVRNFLLGIIHFLKKIEQFFKQVLIIRFWKFRTRISRYAYAFYTYKSKRHKIWPADISKIIVPCELGLVSIVLPVFNGERYINEAIESILSQTYTHFELIVIDDGSTDNTSKILDEYAIRDTRIRVVHQANMKLPQSLNNGFRLAVGEYLTWTSDDNRLKPLFLEKMIACLSSHPSWDMVYANMDIIGEDGNPLRNSSWFAGYHVPYSSEHVHLPFDTYELNTWPNNFIGGAFLYRNRVNSLLGGYSIFQYTREDYDYWMQVNSLLTLKHVNFKTPVYDYRFHSASLTHQDEQLNITRDRKYLMVFDDFRRDFYQMPLVWIFDEVSASSQEKEKIKSIKKILSDRGQILVSSNDAASMNLPQFWIPCIYIKVSSDSNSLCTCPINLTQNCTKVLLCTSTQDLSKNIDVNWDLFLSLGISSNLPKIQNGYQRWWSANKVETLLTSVDIYCRSTHLGNIEKQALQPASESIKISVVICTYHRNQILVKSLEAIAKQTLPQSDYEVLIIDNNPEKSDLPALIDEVRKKHFPNNPEHIRLIHCPILGLSFARNAGISEAKSEILLFLDDDSVVKHDILAHYFKAFSDNPNAGVIGGHIVLKRPDSLPLMWSDGWERYWSQFITTFSDYTTIQYWWEYPWGANWAARRKALVQIGGFRGRYGRQGNDFNGGEEIIASSLIQKLGYSIGVLPQAVVVHHVDRSRFTLNHIKNTIYAGMFVHYQAQLDLYLPFESTFKNNLYQSGNVLVKVVRSIVHPINNQKRAELAETSFIASGRLSLFFRQLREELKRLSLVFYR